MPHNVARPARRLSFSGRMPELMLARNVGEDFSPPLLREHGGICLLEKRDCGGGLVEVI